MHDGFLCRLCYKNVPKKKTIFYFFLKMEIILGIAGKWASEAEFFSQKALNDNGYVFEGETLTQTLTGKQFNVVISPFHNSLIEAFEYGGDTKLSEEDLAEVKNLTFTVYVLGQGGSREAATDIVEVGEVILNAGGLSVKVETSNIMHPAVEWRRFARNKKMVNLFQAFVTIVKVENYFLSVGMHTFGLPEGKIYVTKGEYEYNLLRTFIFNQFSNEKVVKEGELFSLYVDEPTYILKKQEYTEFSKDEFYFNENGIWLLEKK